MLFIFANNLNIVLGRYQDVASELFKLKDRHDTEYLLSPVST